ncbi:hypothetical protein NQ315_000797 [Exocentrus adspersus]|uniref:TIL domain-containing protein n=1 Tax=Exocentrus adspersus TaxID=1586481 RepID=A0AAV8WDX2_9CUCU|nr:hypothetical protein NQ315_000797 [Exocentrus adspersus]
MKLIVFCVVLFALTFSDGKADDVCEDPNAMYKSCGTACPVTCQKRQVGVCIEVCLKGCFCKPPFILDEVSGRCVRSSDCPPCSA